MSNNPFEVLDALRDSLPQGQDVATGNSGDASPAPHKPVLTLFYEAKGRGGKPVTIITGLDDCDPAMISDLARRLKKALATGGSVRGGEILIQGDRRERLRSLLKEQGFKTKG